ncbi:MAG: hypothetical protein ABL898_02330 [Hyphomicrobiaceae bacterium]|nr:DUF2783 domain-containing protein [Hyphomicrobiaceae bacterium]
MTDMVFNDLEAVYERVAVAIDSVGAEKRDVFLAKLVLMLARDVGDCDLVLKAIEACLQDL